MKAALPAGFDVQLLRSEGGEVEVQATRRAVRRGRVGERCGWRAAKASSSRIRCGFLLEALQLTLFSDPHVYVAGRGRERAQRAAAELPADDERESALSARVPARSSRYRLRAGSGGAGSRRGGALGANEHRQAVPWG